MRSYPTPVLLSITTGRLLCDFGDMQECAEFLCDSPVFTHQFAHKPFVDQLKAAVLAQYPQLNVNADGVTPDNWQAWLADQSAVLGQSFEIVPMAAIMDTIQAAFTEPLKGKPVIVLEVSGDVG